MCQRKTIPTAFDNQTDCADNNGTWDYAGVIKYTVKLKAYDVFHIDAKTFAARNELDDKDIEQEIQEKGLDAPRVTPEQSEALMANVAYDHYIVPNTTTTIVTAMLMFEHESPYT